MQKHQPIHLAIESLDFKYGQRALFRNFSLTIKNSAVVYIKGPNGSGKSTLLKILATLLRPNAGTVQINGQRDIRPFLSYLPSENNGLFLDESAFANLRFYQDLCDAQSIDLGKALQTWDIDSKTQFFFPVGRFSTGYKRRVGLLRIIVSERPIWLLDEPLNGLDTRATELLTKEINAHIAKAGICILVSHDERFVRGISTDVQMIDEKMFIT